MKKLISCILVLLLLLPAPFGRASTQDNINTIYTYLTEKLGMNLAVAAGILSNIRYESNFNPEAIGDGGDAYGICQWNSRRQSLINYCEANGFESWKSLEGQLGYLAYELENNKKSVGEYLKTIPNTPQGAYDAAYHFCVYYEIPANRYVKGNTRGTAAVNTYWTMFGGTVEEYTVTYNANGGKNAPDAQTKKEGIPLLLSSESPVRAGYTHAGWALSADAAQVEYEISGTLSENRNLTLYAVWEKSIEAETLPDASVTYAGHTYEFYSGAFTWTYAKSFTAMKGGYLATVRSSDEYNQLLTLTQNASAPCWLGGTYTSGNWVWDSGEAFMDDFAEGKWQSGSPVASYGPNENGRLAQTPAGEWVDLNADTLETGGFIVEYADTDKEEFPLYLICVDTSLRLREGPGTGYDTLSYMYPGTLITIFDTSPAASYDWGWGVTDTGASGWCAMRIPSYMVEASGVDEATGLVYMLNGDGIALCGYRGSKDTLALPDTLLGLSVNAIKADAFPDSIKRITLPAGIREVEKDAFCRDTEIIAPPASAAHAACAQAGYRVTYLYPENSVIISLRLTQIGQEAFSQCESICVLDLADTQLTALPEGAFAGMTALTCIMLPESIAEIHAGAFGEQTNFTVIAPEGSYALTWAQSAGLNTIAVPE